MLSPGGNADAMEIPCKSRSEPGHQALRRGRASLAGQVYLVTFTTHARRPLFADPVLAQVAARAMTRPEAWPDAELLAWVLMPDHWHGLVRLGVREALAKAIGRLKTNSSRQVRKAMPTPCAVWARAFHDHAVRSDEALLPAARYLIANPLRAGLAAGIGDYPYWDARWIGSPP